MMEDLEGIPGQDLPPQAKVSLYDQIGRALFNAPSRDLITFSRHGYDMARMETEALRAFSLRSPEPTTYCGVAFKIDPDQAEDFKVS